MGEKLTFKLLNVDYITEKPDLLLDTPKSAILGANHQKVPIIRLYGRNMKGLSVCVHVHSVFPYMFIEDDGSLDSDIICNRLNAIIGETQRLDYSKNTSVVHNIIKEEKKSFYGFQSKNKNFFKIFYNYPELKQKISQAFNEGKINSHPIDVYEVHYPFILQFILDRNLYGMDYVSITEPLYRKNEPLLEMPVNRSPLSAITTCSIEADCQGNDVSLGDDVQKEYYSIGILKRIRKLSLETSKDQTADLVSTMNRSQGDQNDHQSEKIDEILRKISEKSNKLISPLQFSFSSLDMSLIDDLSSSQNKSCVDQLSQNCSIYTQDTFNLKNQDKCQIEDHDEDEDHNEETLSDAECDFNDNIDLTQSIREIRGNFMNESVNEKDTFTSNLFNTMEEDLTGIDWVDTININCKSNGSNEDCEKTPVSYQYLHQPPSKFIVSSAKIRNKIMSLERGINLETPNLSQYQGSWNRFSQIFQLERHYNLSRLMTPILPFPNLTKKSVNATQFQEASEDFSGLRPFSAISTTAPTRFPTDLSSITEGFKLMSMELLADISHEEYPNPSSDKIYAIFYMLHSGYEYEEPMCRCISTLKFSREISKIFNVFTVESEYDLMIKFFQEVRTEDPDLLLGFQSCKLSWGYLIKRSAFIENIGDAIFQLGRFVENKKIPSPTTLVPSNYHLKEVANNKDGFVGCRHSSSGMAVEYEIAGRLIFNVWRIVKYEKNMSCYSRYNVCFKLFGETFPKYCYKKLAEIFHCQSNSNQNTIQAFNHMRECVYFNFRVVFKLKVISRLTEMCKLTGLPLVASLVRGSQLHVESILLRLCREYQFICPSPSRAQVRQMSSLESLPMIIEPYSQIYYDPVLVFDFQSLYPSVMIAYNYCFSTCIGRISHLINDLHSDKIPIGALTYNPDYEEITKLSPADLSVSPREVGFVKNHVFQGVLPRMLSEILRVRIGAKKRAKACVDDKKLNRVLESYQLGLKMILNTIFGYTSASFSGHMPCTELADSILSKSREVLEKAVRLVRENKRWNAEVIYGDTDSMFVLLPGASLERGFELVEEIVKAVNELNPPPITLKFEKIYYPLYIQCKKRYVGMKHEKLEDAENPIFEAKGVELVRRDFCSLTNKVFESCIRSVFHDRNQPAKVKIENVKNYVLRQCLKIMTGDCVLADFILNKPHKSQHKLLKGEIPQVLASMMKNSEDYLSIPCPGERFQYIVVEGSENSRLYELIASPSKAIKNPNFQINSFYYITRQVLSPLNRMMYFLNCNVLEWYHLLPKHPMDRWNLTHSNEIRLSTCDLRRYYNLNTRYCLKCRSHLIGATKGRLFCRLCSQSEDFEFLLLHCIHNRLCKKKLSLDMFCQSCIGVHVLSGNSLPCEQIGCPVIQKRLRTNKKSKIISTFLKNFKFRTENNST